ncbi:MAG TPA: beta-propeller fold lactonase family protein [Gaiellaceae bacterium]|nr:beta-propeller fold lactonase family protein [Gaiellaceae bacterium]
MNDTQGAVYLQTNDAERNEVVAYTRGDDGSLSYLGAYATGGRGTGELHLPSQSSVVVSGDGKWLFVANPGSDEISLFAIDDHGPRLSDTTSSQGSRPTSIAVHGQLVYVLNNGSADIQGFEIADGKLRSLAGSKRPLSEESADGAQISFSPDGKTLVVTERGTNSISAYAVDDRGYADGPATIPAAGQTPYGFGFTNGGALVVTEAFGGDIGKAAASSYSLAAPGKLEPVSGSVADTRSEVCWAAVTKDGRYVFVTNFGDCTISSYRIGEDGDIELAQAVAGSTRLGKAGIRDEAISSNGRFLYALDADAQKVHGWRVDSDGKLDEIGAFDGVPVTVAGLAAS